MTWLKIPIFIFCCVGRPGLFKCHFTGSIAVCIMENHHTGQEETLMEVTMGMNGVALSHLPRARRRRSCFQCLLALAALLVIGLMAAVMVYFFIFAPQCNPVRNSSLHRRCVLSATGVFVCLCANYHAVRLQDKPTSQDTAKVNQVNKLPGKQYFFLNFFS